jgi:hypothetical protein
MEDSIVRPRPRKGVRFEEIDGEAVIYDRTGTQATYLNETAAIIWQLCDGVRTEAEIIAMLSEAYPEAGDALVDDVRHAIGAMIEAGNLITLPRESALAPAT